MDTLFNVDAHLIQMEAIYQMLVSDYEKDELIQRWGSNLVYEMEVIKVYVRERSSFVRKALKNF